MKVRLEYIHSRFTEDPKLAPLCVFGNELSKNTFTNTPFSGDPRKLELGRCGRDMRIQS
jgi:hypothetical protein